MEKIKSFIAKTQTKDIVPYIVIFCIAAIICQFFGMAIVSGQSMYPTYHDGDVLVYSKIPYITGTPEVNDIAIMTMPKTVFGHKEQIIKRVVAVAGDTVEIKDNKFYRNGKEVKEDYINENMNVEEYKNIGKYTLEEGEIFVMGDNRNHSSDSRYFGPVPLEYVNSKVIFYNETFSNVMHAFYKFLGKV